MKLINAGWSSPVARQAHNLKVVGSNPTPATNNFSQKSAIYTLVTLVYRGLELFHSMSFKNIEFLPFTLKSNIIC